jgi:hypothetical protein
MLAAGGEAQSDGATKTRAYDFILPYKTEGWEPKLFVQCQFYAGDSGSVSHKVVDQTRSSRPLTLVDYPNARFVEYLDGAGYYASLNGDPKHMLGMDSTHSFFQIRSAAIRLRRELQEIGFVTPIDVEHAIMRSKDQTLDSVVAILIGDQFVEKEALRAVNVSLGRSYIHERQGKLEIDAERLKPARRLLILDIIAISGTAVKSIEDMPGKMLIPGSGPYYGTHLQEISEKIDVYAPNSKYDRHSFAADITWLAEMRLILSK